MIDVAYVLGTVDFFALMFAYVRGCERLGRAAAETVHPETPQP